MPTLHWIGKEKVVKHHHDVPLNILRSEYEYNAPEGSPVNSTGNRIIHGDNSDSARKLKLGAAWANQAGRDYRYFMVFDNKSIGGAHKLADALVLLGQL